MSVMNAMLKFPSVDGAMDYSHVWDDAAYDIVPGNWYLLGVPFLIKTRRMLDGMDTGKATNAYYCLLFCCRVGVSFVGAVSLRILRRTFMYTPLMQLPKRCTLWHAAFRKAALDTGQEGKIIALYSFILAVFEPIPQVGLGFLV